MKTVNACEVVLHARMTTCVCEPPRQTCEAVGIKGYPALKYVVCPPAHHAKACAVGTACAVSTNNMLLIMHIIYYAGHRLVSVCCAIAVEQTCAEQQPVPRSNGSSIVISFAQSMIY